MAYFGTMALYATLVSATYQWPLYRELELISPRSTFNATPTYARPYASLSSLVNNQTTTTWPADPSPTDYDEKYGRAALSSLWASIPVSSPPFTTTVLPTPIPSHELIKPPPLHIDDETSNLTFPSDIQWGFAGAALQIEGAIKEEGRGPSIWEDNFRGNYSQFKDGGPPDIATMNYYLYKQDIARLAAVGVQAYSFSISWSRIVPFGVAGSPINQEGIDHYNDVINTVLAFGMTPVITLHHFDAPLYFKTNTSFLAFDHPDFVDGFEYYARTVLVHYADRVGTWYTFNEPTLEANLMRHWTYSRNVLMAHARVVRWYRSEIKGSGKWSMKLDLTNTGFALPLDPSNESDVGAAVRRNKFSFGYFANPLFRAEQVPEDMIEALGDKVPQYTQQELEFINGTADFFAFDIYTATYHSMPAGGYKQCVENKGHSEWPACTSRSRTRGTWESNFQGQVDRPAVPSEHIRSILGYMHHEYPTEGGVTIGEYGLPIYKAREMSLEHHVNDITQSYFYIPILREVLKAINYDGVRVKGLFGWTYLDNWEWGQYGDCYGVQTFNRSTLERTYKRAIFDYSDFMQKHTLRP